MNNSIVNNMKRGYMSATILSLLEANNTITTLEVKNELRNLHPEYTWNQKYVSDYMSEMHLSGDLTYEDNGTFRVYSGEAPKKSTSKTVKGKKLPKVKMQSISKTKAFDLITGNKGYFFTAEFEKKSGDIRVINCQILKDQDYKLGYIKVKEASKMRTDPKNCIRQINMQTLKSIKIAGVAYKVK